MISLHVKAYQNIRPEISMFQTVEDLGDPNLFLLSKGVLPNMLDKIGGIVVVGGNIEYILEQAFVTLSGGKVEGDLPGASRLIFMFRKLNESKPSQYCKAIDLWCTAAFIYMSCRNSIIHGNASPMGDSVWFAKSFPIEGAKRKQPYSDFHADPHTLGLFLNAGTLLSRVINIINYSLTKKMHFDEELLISAIQNARSICNELNDLAAVYNSEKY